MFIPTFMCPACAPSLMRLLLRRAVLPLPLRPPRSPPLRFRLRLVRSHVQPICQRWTIPSSHPRQQSLMLPNETECPIFLAHAIPSYSFARTWLTFKKLRQATSLLFYCVSFLIPLNFKRDHCVISSAAAEIWNNLDPLIKAHWHRLAVEEKQRHQARFPGYTYCPTKKVKKLRTPRRADSDRITSTMESFEKMVIGDDDDSV